MIGKKSIARIAGVLYAAVFGSLITFGIYAHWSNVSIALLVPLAAVVFVAFYFVGRWIEVRSELNKKLPTSGKELRRRTKEFYDSLDSQERHGSRR
jgi:hypothetical protein